jgi:hypothetical protein
MSDDIQEWITSFCAGTTYVRVGHMMCSSNENIKTQTLEESLCLIREHEPVQLYINNDPVKCQEVAQFVASIISNKVITTFKSAVYYGD